MKYSVLFITLFIFGFLSDSWSQEYDTIYHSNTNYTGFDFILADTNVTAFKVSKINTNILEKDTTEYSIEVDTFFVKRKRLDSGELVYDYWYSKRYWINTVLGGSNCGAYEKKIALLPVFELKWFEHKQAFEFGDCEEQRQKIYEALLLSGTCLHTQKYHTIKKSIMEEFETMKDCELMTSRFLYDLGHLISYVNFPVPVRDSTIYFSIFDKKDTMGLLNVHFYSRRMTTSNTTTIQIGEDLSRSAPTTDKMVGGWYDAIKGMLSPEEQKRDSIRMVSAEDHDLTTIEIDGNGYFKSYKRDRYYSLLNIDLKRKKSTYRHLIEKIP